MLPIRIMRFRNLRDVDLNLLVTLEALLHERHVTRAAERLGLSQPAVSRALGRLRGLFNDALLVQEGKGYQLTPRAERLLEPVGSTLEQVSRMLQTDDFDPKAARGSVRLEFPDHFTLVFGPMLLGRVRAEAPHLDLVFDSWSAGWRRRLTDGHVALTFGVPGGEESNLHCRRLVDDPWVCLLRRRHPALRRRWTRQQFSILEHGIMTVTGAGPGHVDHALAQHGLRRRIVVRAASPVVIAMMVVESDLVVTTSALLAQHLAQRHPLVIKPVPLAVPPLELPMIWHQRTHHDPLNRWIRGLIRDVVERHQVAVLKPGGSQPRRKSDQPRSM